MAERLVRSKRPRVLQIAHAPQGVGRPPQWPRPSLECKRLRAGAKKSEPARVPRVLPVASHRFPPMLDAQRLPPPKRKARTMVRASPHPPGGALFTLRGLKHEPSGNFEALNSVNAGSLASIHAMRVKAPGPAWELPVAVDCCDREFMLAVWFGYGRRRPRQCTSFSTSCSNSCSRELRRSSALYT